MDLLTRTVTKYSTQFLALNSEKLKKIWSCYSGIILNRMSHQMKTKITGLSSNITTIKKQKKGKKSIQKILEFWLRKQQKSMICFSVNLLHVLCVSTVRPSKSGSKSCQTQPFLFSKYGYQDPVCTRTSGWLHPCVNIPMVIAWQCCIIS